MAEELRSGQMVFEVLIEAFAFLVAAEMVADATRLVSALSQADYEILEEGVYLRRSRHLTGGLRALRAAEERCVSLVEALVRASVLVTAWLDAHPHADAPDGARRT